MKDVIGATTRNAQYTQLLGYFRGARDMDLLEISPCEASQTALFGGSFSENMNLADPRRKLEWFRNAVQEIGNAQGKMEWIGRSV
jgi:hypothetical protein